MKKVILSLCVGTSLASLSHSMLLVEQRPIALPNSFYNIVVCNELYAFKEGIQSFC